MALQKNLGCFKDSCKENPCQIAKASFQIFYWWFRRLPFFSVTTVTTAYYTLLCHIIYIYTHTHTYHISDTPKISKGRRGRHRGMSPNGVGQQGTQLPHCAARCWLRWDLRYASNRPFAVPSFCEVRMIVWGLVTIYTWYACHLKCSRTWTSITSSDFKVTWRVITNLWIRHFGWILHGLRRRWGAPGGLRHGALLAQPGTPGERPWIRRQHRGCNQWIMAVSVWKWGTVYPPKKKHKKDFDGEANIDVEKPWFP